MSRTRLVLILVVLALVNLAFSATKCAELKPTSIRLGSVVVSIRGPDLDISLVSTPASPSLGGISWKLGQFTERQRTYYRDETGYETIQCIAPRPDPIQWLLNPGAGYLDPLEPMNVSKACTGRFSNDLASVPHCGKLLSSMKLDEMFCDQVVRLNDSIQGVPVQTITVAMSHPDYAGFKLLTTYQIASDDIVNATFETFTNYTQLVTYLYVPFACHADFLTFSDPYDLFSRLTWCDLDHETAKTVSKSHTNWRTTLLSITPLRTTWAALLTNPMYPCGGICPVRTDPILQLKPFKEEKARLSPPSKRLQTPLIFNNSLVFFCPFMIQSVFGSSLEPWMPARLTFYDIPVALRNRALIFLLTDAV